jgi:hypothetical protein
LQLGAVLLVRVFWLGDYRCFLVGKADFDKAIDFNEAERLNAK